VGGKTSPSGFLKTYMQVFRCTDFGGFNKTWTIGDLLHTLEMLQWKSLVALDVCLAMVYANDFTSLVTCYYA
jgi:hypothetical protein